MEVTVRNAKPAFLVHHVFDEPDLAFIAVFKGVAVRPSQSVGGSVDGRHLRQGILRGTYHIGVPKVVRNFIVRVVVAGSQCEEGQSEKDHEKYKDNTARSP